MDIFERRSRIEIDKLIFVPVEIENQLKSVRNVGFLSIAGHLSVPFGSLSVSLTTYPYLSASMYRRRYSESLESHLKIVGSHLYRVTATGTFGDSEASYLIVLYRAKRRADGMDSNSRRFDYRSHYHTYH